MKLFRLFSIIGISLVAMQAQATDDVSLQALLEKGLPVVEITTVDGEEPAFEIADAPEGLLGGSIRNATKVPGCVVVYSVGGGIAYDSGDYAAKESGMTVKVRGNWSARRPKQPFKIKLQKKADMLSRGDHRFDDKDWLLMPFFEMNAFIGFKVNELMGLQWTPRYQYVNLVFNGDFRGLYMLMESVKRNRDCRLNVDKKTGYIMELDAYWWNEDRYVEAGFPEKMNYTFKYPDDDDVTPAQMDYIQQVLTAAEASTLDDTYQQHIDVESFARWMLAHDILGNRDGAGANMYITKYNDRDTSLLKMGCLWDFDVIMESAGWDEIHGRYFFGRLFANSDSTFTKRYMALWDETKDQVFDALARCFDDYQQSALRQAVDASIPLNNDRWARLMYGLPLSAEMIDDARSWFAMRKDWLDRAVHGLATPVASPVAEEPTERQPIVYDLTGRRLSSMPTAAGVYIVDGRKVLR